MQSDPKKLVEKNKNLTHSELLKVTSHVQREQGDWILHTLLVEGCDVPFKFKRKGKYLSINNSAASDRVSKQSELAARFFTPIHNL